ncbi:MAG: NrfD/PsrC family molybdoenzyme membrane anchor subunit [Chloroflexota bacterium]
MTGESPGQRQRSRGQPGDRDRRPTPPPPVPVIHGAHWKWLVIVYFFLGGISGAAAAIGGIERYARPRGPRRIARAARHVALLAFRPCPILLVLDLGRPSRFLNMLRVLKLRSPMSFGSWALVLFGGVAVAASARQAAEDGLLPGGPVRQAALIPPEAALDAAAVVTGTAVAGYTGVLLATTAVPLWAKRPGLLGSLFVTSAFATGAAAVALADPGRHEVSRFKQAASLAEAAALFAWLNRLGPAGKPLAGGALGAIVRHGVAGAGVALPLALNAMGHARSGRMARALTVASSLLPRAGGYALRYALVVGGRASADDPEATFAFTRSLRDGAP